MKLTTRLCGVFLFVACFALAGCSRKIDSTELIGKYAMKSKHAAQMLELKADGSYTETVTSPDGLETISSNRWYFLAGRDEPWVDLQLPDGDCFLQVHRSIDGNLRLNIGSGNALFYEKIR